MIRLSIKIGWTKPIAIRTPLHGLFVQIFMISRRGGTRKAPLISKDLNRGRDARVLPQEKTSAKVIPPRLETQRFFPPK